MSLLVGSRQQHNILRLIWKNFNQQQWKKAEHSSILNEGIKRNTIQLQYRCHSSNSQINLVPENENKFEFHHEWPIDVKNDLCRDMILFENFVNETEEERLFAEVQKSMKRMRYQYDHWDDAIHGYPEMEKVDWLPENEKVFQRLRETAFIANVLPHVHILDLAADGIIKTHVDSSRYCGSTIAGLSLLTDCIMRLKRIDENKYKQGRAGEDEIQTNSTEKEQKFEYFVDILLKRRSLYIMKDSARYKFTHEVLPTKSIFNGNEIIKERRLSIICRDQA